MTSMHSVLKSSRLRGELDGDWELEGFGGSRGMSSCWAFSEIR